MFSKNQILMQINKVYIKKIGDVEKLIPDISILVNNTAFNTKIGEFKIKYWMLADQLLILFLIKLQILADK